MTDRREERRNDRRREDTGRVAHVKDGYTVSHLFGPGISEALEQRLFDYFNGLEVYSGDSIMQSGEPVMLAAQVLADIADDILCFKVTYDD